MGQRRAVVLRALRSAGLTLVVVVVFGALYASADAVFAAYLPRLDVGRLPAQLVVGATVGLAALAAAHLAVAPPAWPGPVAAGRARLADWLAPVVALDLVVVAFLAVQVGGLVGGHAHVLATAGLTYAQYARAGFGQLVVATALTLVVVAVAARRAPRQTVLERRLTAAALGVLCVGTLGVVASALRRMTLYVDAFGLTRLRLLVLVAEVVLGVLLVLVLVAGVRWRAGWLPRAAVHAVVAGVAALVLANPDALIVRFDAAADAPLDVGYLSGLSADAVPAAAAVDEPLRSCLLQLAASDPPADEGWVSWNAGRAAAARVLAADAAGRRRGRLRLRAERRVRLGYRRPGRAPRGATPKEGECSSRSWSPPSTSQATSSRWCAAWRRPSTAWTPTCSTWTTPPTTPPTWSGGSPPGRGSRWPSTTGTVASAGSPARWSRGCGALAGRSSW